LPLPGRVWDIRSGVAPPDDNAAAPAKTDPRVSRARDFFGSFLKGLKRLAVYRHDPKRFPEFLAQAHQLLGVCLGGAPLALDVEPERLSLHGEALLPEGTPETLAQELYRDGIRQLVFRPEVSLDELVSFALIAAGEGGARRGADLQAALWAAALPHVGYVAVKGLGVESGQGGSEGGETSPADALVAGLGQQLAAVDPGIEAEAAELQGIEPVTLGGEAEGLTAELAKRIQDELAEDGRLVFSKLAELLVQLLPEEMAANAQGLWEQILRLADTLLARGEADAALRLLDSIGAAPAGAEARASLLERLTEPDHLGPLLELLRGPPVARPDALRSYLAALPPARVLPTLLEALAGFATPENRRLACDALAALCGGDPALFEAQLDGDSPTAVHDALYVLDKLELAGKARFFTRAMHNRSADVRLEVLDVLVSSQTPGVRSFLSSALADPSPLVRGRAARALVEADPAAGARELQKAAQAPEFGKRTAEERGAVYAALGWSGQPEALGFLARVLQKSAGLFGRKAAQEEKLLAIAALAESGSIAAFKLLEAFVQGGAAEGPEVLVPARKAMHDIQQALRGKR